MTPKLLHSILMWACAVYPGFGGTNEVGEGAAVNRCHLRDLHATILHLMGFDHEKLTYSYGALENKLTGVVEAHSIHGIIA